MAIWHLQDNRYKQERVLLFVSVFGLIAGLGFMTWLYWPGRAAASFTVSSDLPAETRPGGAGEEAARTEQIRELYRQLDAAGDAGDVDSTARLAHGILALKPDDPDAWIWLGWVHSQRGETRSSIEAYDRAAARASDRRAFAMYQKACVLRSLGDVTGALEVMKESVRLHPESIEVGNLLMIFQIQAGEEEAVRTMLKGYAAIDLDSQKSAWLLGAAALAMHDGDKARACALLDDFEGRVSSAGFRQMLRDAFFEPFRSRPEYLSYFLNSGKMPPFPAAG